LGRADGGKRIGADLSPRAVRWPSVSSEAARQQLRRVVSVEDHDFPGSLCGRHLGLVDSGVILNPLFGPRRCIAVPVVLYCYIQEIVSRYGRPRSVA
jgi:hypothetical protein